MSFLNIFDSKKDPMLRELLAEFPNASPEAVETVLRFLKVAANIRIKEESTFGKFGLTSGRFSILMILRQEPTRKLAPSELAKRAKVSRATMTQFIDALEKDEFVRRAADLEDRRSLLIELTPKGESILKQVLPLHIEGLGRVCKALSKSELQQMHKIIARISQSVLEGEAPDSEHP